jgi:hypothetical protein
MATSDPHRQEGAVGMGGDVEFVGPFEYHAVCVNGWRVPYLTATPVNGGRVELCLDHRYAMELSVKDAECVVPFIANAIAIAKGYTAHPSESETEPLPPTARHPFNRMIAL